MNTSWPGVNNGWPGVNNWHRGSAGRVSAINVFFERQFSPIELSLGC
jgi:hypothetical protein